MNPTGADAALGSAVHDLLARWIAAREPLWEQVEPVAGGYRVDAAALLPVVVAAWDCWQQLAPSFPEPRLEDLLILRAAPEDDWLLSGHIDVLSVLPGEVRIIDWKSSWQEGDHDDQLRGYSLLACRAHNRPLAYAAVVRPRLKSIDGRYYSREELEVWWAEFKKRLTQAAYNPGQHCGYCPHQADCPARGGYLAAGVQLLLNDCALPSGPGWRALTETQRGDLLLEAFRRLKAVEAATALARDLIHAEVAAAGGVLRASTSELRLREEERKNIDARKAWPMLQARLGDGLLDCLDVRKGKVERRVKDAAPRGEKLNQVKALLADLDAAGALTTTIITRLEIRHGQTDELTHDHRQPIPVLGVDITRAGGEPAPGHAPAQPGFPGAAHGQADVAGAS